MGLWGIGIGAWIGSQVGGPLGAIIGAVVGGMVTKKPNALNQRTGDPSCGSGPGPDPRPTPEEQQTVFLGAMAAMLAKLAKSDGRVTKEEIDCASSIFARLGLTDGQRTFCISVFRRAKDDSSTIYAYARNFASVQTDRHVREIFYSLLWDMAVADGRLSSEENEILNQIPLFLGVRRTLYTEEYRRRIRGAGDGERESSRSNGPVRGGMTLAEAYAVLSIPSSATDADVKKPIGRRQNNSIPMNWPGMGFLPK